MAREKGVLGSAASQMLECLDPGPSPRPDATRAQYPHRRVEMSVAMGARAPCLRRSRKKVPLGGEWGPFRRQARPSRTSFSRGICASTSSVGRREPGGRRLEGGTARGRTAAEKCQHVRAPEIPAAHACRAAHPPLPAAGRWPSGASYRTTSGRRCAVRPLRARRAARGAPPSAKKGKAKRGATKMCCLPPPSARVEFDRCNKRVTH